MNASVEARFWAKVDKTDTCWLWTGAKTKDGYSSFYVGERTDYGHRFAYELLLGPIPSTLQLDHVCRVRHCVRPDHLEAVTQKENLLRGSSDPAINARKSVCPNGHPYDAVTKGRRYCRTCINAKNRMAYHSRATKANPWQYRQSGRVS